MQQRSASPAFPSRATALALCAAAVGTFLAVSASLAADGAPAAAASAAAPKSVASVRPASAADRLVERGRYLVKVTGCNDCHTPHYPEKAGAIPESAWLTGAPVGFNGPWGTTYPTNLRTHVASISEAEWLARARQPMRPPMPWFALRDMTDGDLRAIYAYVKHLGAAGDRVPAYVPPGGKVATPFIVFVPQNLPAASAASAAASQQ